MPINVYTPSSDVIIKNTKVDFNCHQISSDVRITQYDDSLTILAIALYKDGVSYTLPASLSAKLLMYRSDRIGISEIALGCDANRQVLYFAITREMSKLDGDVSPVVKLSNAANQVVASASFQMTIERNPIQDDGEVVDPSGNHIWPDSDKVVSISGSTFASLVGTATNIGYYTINDSSSATYLSGDDYYIDSNGVAHLITEIQSLTWSALKALCDSSLLAPGKSYRITDYVCTTVQENTHSAGHPFDIIVVADGVNSLSEDARAIAHAGDTYFSNATLGAWKIKYCLENDIHRFSWADALNGKGVIYRMIDEWGNDCPYDFKNIQFKRKVVDGWYNSDTGADEWVYTFTAYQTGASTGYEDATLLNGLYQLDDADIICKNNVVEIYNQVNRYPSAIRKQELNDIVFLNLYSAGDNSYFECYSNLVKSDCTSISFGNACFLNTIEGCCTNVTLTDSAYNRIGKQCSQITISGFSNVIESSCYHITILSGFQNHIGPKCGNISLLEGGCQNNIFESNVNNVSLGVNSAGNVFGSRCGDIDLLGSTQNSVFGALCGCLTKSVAFESPIHVDPNYRGASSVNKLDLYDAAVVNKNYLITYKKAQTGEFLMTWVDKQGDAQGMVKATNLVATWTPIVNENYAPDVTVTKEDILGAYGGTQVTDLNSIVFSGFYTCLGTATGVPNSSSSWYVTHVNSNTGTTEATQTAVSFGTMVIYYRVKTASTWGAWVQETNRTAFNNAAASLDGAVIKGVPYKTVPCGNASGTSSTASGTSSTASGAMSTVNGYYSSASGMYSTANGANSAANGFYSTASGYCCYANGFYSTASGYYSSASGMYSTANGANSAANGMYSTAIGCYSLAKIDKWASFDGNNSSNTLPQNRYITSFSPDYVLFRNADVDYNATATSAYANLKTLTDYLGTGAPNVVTTETLAGIFAGTSANFDVAGTGTSGDPYIVTPKVNVNNPHARKIYQITATAPASNTYFRFKASGVERCMVRIISNLSTATYSYFLNFIDLYGHVRSRNRLNGGTLVSTDIDSKTSNAEIYLDVNSPEMYATQAI